MGVRAAAAQFWGSLDTPEGLRRTGNRMRFYNRVLLGLLAVHAIATPFEAARNDQSWTQTDSLQTAGLALGMIMVSGVSTMYHERQAIRIEQAQNPYRARQQG